MVPRFLVRVITGGVHAMTSWLGVAPARFGFAVLALYCRPLPLAYRPCTMLVIENGRGERARNQTGNSDA
jgi:hypothetical protein